MVKTVVSKSGRELLGMLRTFANVYLCLGGAFSIHHGLEQLAAEIGEERLLFGTGFPRAEPAAAVAQLMYAAVSEDQRGRIGSANLEWLIGGIQR